MSRLSFINSKMLSNYLRFFEFQHGQIQISSTNQTTKLSGVFKPALQIRLIIKNTLINNYKTYIFIEREVQNFVKICNKGSNIKF